MVNFGWSTKRRIRFFILLADKLRREQNSENKQEISSFAELEIASEGFWINNMHYSFSFQFDCDNDKTGKAERFVWLLRYLL